MTFNKISYARIVGNNGKVSASYAYVLQTTFRCCDSRDLSINERRKIRGKSSLQSRLRETSQQLSVAPGQRRKNEQ